MTAPLLTTIEAAERLAISVPTLRKHIAEGALRVIIIGAGRKRRHIRIAESDIREFEDSRRCQFSPAPTRRTITMSSRSTVLDFEELRVKLRGGKLSKLKSGSGTRSKRS